MLYKMGGLLWYLVGVLLTDAAPAFHVPFLDRFSSNGSTNKEHENSSTYTCVNTCTDTTDNKQ